MKILLNGFLICPTLAEADRISHLLPAHLQACRAEPGCLKVEVFRSQEDPTRFAASHLFRDRAAFDAHVENNRKTEWWVQTQGCKRDLTVSEVE